MPRHFSDEEAQRVFARAAARQHAHAPPPAGLTLAELQEIGREAGLDPSHIAAVVAETDAEAEGQNTWHGVALGVPRTRLLADRVSDAEWEAIVDMLRTHFKTQGVAQQVGRRRGWAPMSGAMAAHQVTIEPRPEGDLVRIQSPDSARLFGLISGGAFGAIGVLVAALAALGPGDAAGSLALGGAAFLFGALLYALAFFAAKAREPRTATRHEALLDRIDLLSRPDAATSSPTADRSTSARRAGLGLDELADAPEASETEGTRRRTSS